MSLSIVLATPDAGSTGTLQQVLARLPAGPRRLHVIEVDHRRDERELSTMLLEKARHLGAQVIGGYSLGARIATCIAGPSGAGALIALAYPFHRKGQPEDTHGLHSLRTLSIPALVLQGTRDSHGSSSELRGYGALPANIEVRWFQDANHELLPRQSSPSSQEQHLEDAALAIDDFLERMRAAT